MLTQSFRLSTFPFCRSASEENGASMLLLALKSFLMWGKKQKRIRAIIKSFQRAHGQLPFWLKQMGFELLPAVFRINSNWSFIVYKHNKISIWFVLSLFDFVIINMVCFY